MSLVAFLLSALLSLAPSLGPNSGDAGDGPGGLTIDLSPAGKGA